MPEFVKVAKTSDITPGEAKAVDIGAKRIAIFNIEGTYHAIDDKCTHRGGPLSEGMLVGNEGGKQCFSAERIGRAWHRPGPKLGTEFRSPSGPGTHPSEAGSTNWDRIGRKRVSR
jgi:nitrite reductase/ring-hydroxylating ferredoxin subunit